MGPTRQTGETENHVVLHEFAHHLDQEGGVSDGRPVLQEPALVASWARVLERQFESLHSSLLRQVFKFPELGSIR